jgi:NAD(P)-dependent dehydrogenase (short-subunit alcohol dehydrogenase family)
MADVRTIVITGASRGLGRALIEQFVRSGHRVAGCARSEAAVAKLSREFGQPHLFDAVDVTDYAAVERWSKKVLDAFGPPDLLLNNAAVINENARLWETPADEFSRVVDVNVKGTFHVVRCFVPEMVKQRAGIIVNFSSGWGRSTSPEVAPYCATKWAIEGMTGALAEELPAGMAAVPLNPGIINTEMLQSCFGAGASSYPSPEQWAQKAAPFLLGLSSRDNGEALTVPQ